MLYTFDKSDMATCIAVLGLLYTIYYNKTKEKRESKKEKKQFFKKLVEMVVKITFYDTQNEKDTKLDTLRDELNFCEVFHDNEKDYLTFSEKIDDDFYILTTDKCEQNFKEIQNNLLTYIRNFKV